MAWLSDWTYRKKITLSRVTGAVSNYQMKLLLGESSGATGESIDCGGHCLSSFNDIRFTTSNGETQLDYWIESISGATPNQLATIWIEFDSIGVETTTFYCYSKDSDILTKHGWRNLKELVESGEQCKIATRNPSKNIVEYHLPTTLFKLPYKGKLLHQKGKQIDFQVTPNHRVWAKKDWKRTGSGNPCKKGFELIEASKLPRHIRYERSFPYEGKEVEHFTIPAYGKQFQAESCSQKFNGVGVIQRKSYTNRKTREPKTFLMDDFLRVFGIWLAEGSLRKSGEIVISQKTESKAKKITEWVKKLGYPNAKWYANSDVIFCDVQFNSWLKQFGHSHDKWIPEELKNLSKRQMNILLDAMMLGDGSRDDSHFYYATVSRRLADDVQEIALKAGYVTTLSERKDGIYIINISENNRTPAPNEHDDKREWVDYDDYVYCVEVPNHIVYVRRNGKANWNGNCYYGNANAAAVSNGTVVFPFFDDFSGTALDGGKWSITTDSTVAVGSSEVVITGRASANSVIYTGNNFGEGYAMRARVKTAHFDSTAYREFGGWREGPTGNTHALTMCCHSVTKNAHYNARAGAATSSAMLGGIAAATYSIWDIIRSNGVSTVFKNNDANTVTITSNYPTVNCGLVFEAGTSTDAKVYVDWVFIRQFLATEPVWGGYGSEETLNTTKFSSQTTYIGSSGVSGGVINRDINKQLYRSSKSFEEQMRQPTERDAAILDKFRKESEFVKPYASDSYEEMEYDFIPPYDFKNWPDIIFPDVPWVDPILKPWEPPPVRPWEPWEPWTPPPVRPWEPPPPVRPWEPPPPVRPWEPPPYEDPKETCHIVLWCSQEVCYCPGETKCFQIKCSHRVVSMQLGKFIGSGTAGFSIDKIAGNEVCITAPADAHETLRIKYLLEYQCNGKKFYEWVESQAWVDACAESECCDDTEIAWDDPNSADTIARSSSAGVAILDPLLKGGPYNWSVSGTGFTLASAQTIGLTNTLYANAFACGAATITVTGCNGKVATGYVRCTTGQWVTQPEFTPCPWSGTHGEMYCGGGSCTYETVIWGKFKVQQQVDIAYNFCSVCLGGKTFAACEETRHAVEGLAANAYKNGDTCFDDDALAGTECIKVLPVTNSSGNWPGPYYGTALGNNCYEYATDDWRYRPMRGHCIINTNSIIWFWGC